MKLPSLSKTLTPRPVEIIRKADYRVAREQLRKIHGEPSRSPSQSSSPKKYPKKFATSNKIISKIKFIPHEAVDLPSNPAKVVRIATLNSPNNLNNVHEERLRFKAMGIGWKADSKSPRQDDPQMRHVMKYGSTQEGGSLFNKSLQESMRKENEMTAQKINRKMQEVMDQLKGSSSPFSSSILKSKKNEGTNSTASFKELIQSGSSSKNYNIRYGKSMPFNIAPESNDQTFDESPQNQFRGDLKMVNSPSVQFLANAPTVMTMESQDFDKKIILPSIYVSENQGYISPMSVNQSAIKLRRFEKLSKNERVDKSLVNNLSKQILIVSPKPHSLNLNKNYFQVKSVISDVFNGNQKTLSKAEIDLKFKKAQQLRHEQETRKPRNRHRYRSVAPQTQSPMISNKIEMALQDDVMESPDFKKVSNQDSVSPVSSRIPVSRNSSQKLQNLGKSSQLKRIFGTHDFTPKEFIKMIEDQVGDVQEFLRLKGINLNNPEHYNQMMAQGMDVKNYFRKKEERQQQLQKEQLEITKNMSDEIKKKYNKKRSNSKNVQETEEFKLAFRRVKPEIETFLTQNPLKIKGYGLPEQFHHLFAEETEPVEKKTDFENSKNHQIFLDKMCLRGHLQQKQKENFLMEEMQEYLRPIEKLLKSDLKKLKQVEGLKLIDDDEMEHIELKECLGPEFTKDEDKLNLLKNQESKLSIRTIRSIKSKSSKLTQKQLIKAFDDLEVSSQESDEISIAQSSSCSIYQPIEMRLQKVYGHDEKYKLMQKMSKIKTIEKRCPAEELNDVVRDLKQIEDYKLKKEILDQNLRNNKIKLKDKYSKYTGKQK